MTENNLIENEDEMNPYFSEDRISDEIEESEMESSDSDDDFDEDDDFEEEVIADSPEFSDEQEEEIIEVPDDSEDVQIKMEEPTSDETQPEAPKGFKVLSFEDFISKK
jgi:hypothetical protein